MIPPTFTIDTDPAREFLHLTLAGDWDQPTAIRFGEAVTGAIGTMLAAGARHGHFLTLLDMSRKNILPQNVAAEFAKMNRPDSPSRRIAMVVSGAVHMMQAKRISNDSRRRCFDTEAAARAWLFGTDG
jgi:hypothetical protein